MSHISTKRDRFVNSEYYPSDLILRASCFASEFVSRCKTARLSKLISVVGISWDTVKKTLLSNPALYARGVAFGLHRCILLNPGQTIISQEMMARTFEALIGAVQIDGGTEAAKKVIAHLGFFEDRIWGVRSA
jgi:hypothetical protein